MATIELGSESDAHSSTFCLADEDHTLGNSLRFVLNHEMFPYKHSKIPKKLQCLSVINICLKLWFHISALRDRISLDCGYDICPRVAFCGYSVPHPSENRVNVRVQTTGASAKEVFKDALQDLILISDHVRTTFERAVENYKATEGVREMSMKSGITHQSSTKSSV